jgi:hypothetical protein
MIYETAAYLPSRPYRYNFGFGGLKEGFQREQLSQKVHAEGRDVCGCTAKHVVSTESS